MIVEIIRRIRRTFIDKINIHGHQDVDIVLCARQALCSEAESTFLVSTQLADSTRFSGGNSRPTRNRFHVTRPRSHDTSPKRRSAILITIKISTPSPSQSSARNRRLVVSKATHSSNPKLRRNLFSSRSRSPPDPCSFFHILSCQVKS